VRFFSSVFFVSPAIAIPSAIFISSDYEETTASNANCERTIFRARDRSHRAETFRLRLQEPGARLARTQHRTLKNPSHFHHSTMKLPQFWLLIVQPAESIASLPLAQRPPVTNSSPNDQPFEVIGIVFWKGNPEYLLCFVQVPNILAQFAMLSHLHLDFRHQARSARQSANLVIEHEHLGTFDGEEYSARQKSLADQVEYPANGYMTYARLLGADTHASAPREAPYKNADFSFG
jgi:hypothetical protein